MNIFPTKLPVSLVFTPFLGAKCLPHRVVIIAHLLSCCCQKRQEGNKKVHLFVAVQCRIMWLLLISNVDFYSICKTFRTRANSKPQSLEFSDLSLEFSMQASAQFSVYCLIWADKGMTHVFQAALNLGN